MTSLSCLSAINLVDPIVETSATDASYVAVGGTPKVL
jgi:hypothetical protein